jgi:hypothetical protein
VGETQDQPSQLSFHPRLNYAVLMLECYQMRIKTPAQFAEQGRKAHSRAVFELSEEISVYGRMQD